MRTGGQLRAIGLAVILSWGWKRAAIALAAGALSALAMAPLRLVCSELPAWVKPVVKVPSTLWRMAAMSCAKPWVVALVGKVGATMNSARRSRCVFQTASSPHHLFWPHSFRLAGTPTGSE